MNSRTFGRVLLLAFLPVLAYGLYNYYQFTHGLRWHQADAPGAHIAAHLSATAHTHPDVRATQDDAQLFCLAGALGVVIGFALISAADKQGEHASVQGHIAEHYARIAALRACPVCADQFPATTVNSQQDDQAHQATDRHPPAHTLQSAQRRV
jgi:hypothetical protein